MENLKYEINTKIILSEFAALAKWVRRVSVSVYTLINAHNKTSSYVYIREIILTVKYEYYVVWQKLKIIDIDFRPAARTKYQTKFDETFFNSALQHKTV